jgi:hypothetical protein
MIKSAIKKAAPKAKPEAKLLANFQKAEAARKLAGAKADIARARITARGYDIDNEYSGSGSKMTLKPLRGIKGLVN